MCAFELRLFHCNMYDTIPSKYLSLILADFSHVKTLSIRFDRKANICCTPAHSVKTTFNSYSLSWRHENSYSNTWKQLKQMTYFFPIWKIFISNKMEINSFYQCLCKLTREKKNINYLNPWKTHTHTPLMNTCVNNTKQKLAD